MQNSELTRYERQTKKKKKKKKKERERPSEQFQNQQKKRQDGYGLKDQIHGAQQRLTSVEVFDGKIERVWKRKENGGGIKREKN